jgi:methylmalonyl-CoA/ethylmalonyl-CoA epimerase
LSDTLGELGAVLDHVAHGVPSIRRVLPIYREMLGGTVTAAGISPTGGHLAVHLSYAGGGRIELMEPLGPDSPSLGAFLRRSPRGGLHHLTFKVSDLAHALQVVSARGFDPFGIQLDSGSWREAFLHPRQTGGVLIQLAEMGSEPAEPDASLEDLLAIAEASRSGAAREQGSP